MAWRPEEIRDRFKAVAESARRYAEEVARRPDKSDYDRELQDAYLAVFCVYGYFADAPFLGSREALLSELQHLLAFFARQTGKPGARLTDEARAALARYPWPGNVRELRNAIERGVILASGMEVGLSDLPAQVGATLPGGVMEVGSAVTLEALEAEHIRRVLANRANLDEAATVLGIDPSTLYRKRKRHGL